MNDQLIVITGASSGIGAAIAESALADGAKVITISRRPGPGDHRAIDLSDPSCWAETVQWTDSRIRAAVSDGVRRVSYVHNAGTLDPIGFAGEVDVDGYQANVLLNGAAGQILGAGFVATMNDLDAEGLLVMMSSGAGKRPITGWSSYCAAKAALDMWVRVVALEQGERDSNVVVASVGPGVVDTPMQAEIRSREPEAFPDVERFRAFHADGELASPDHVGRMYWELCRRSDIEQGTVASITDLVSLE